MDTLKHALSEEDSAEGVHQRANHFQPSNRNATNKNFESICCSANARGLTGDKF